MSTTRNRFSDKIPEFPPILETMPPQKPPVALPVALPIAENITGLPVGDPLTNIGTSELAHRAALQAKGILPGPLPVAQLIEGPLDDPLWIARWQPSATVPLSKAPWVIGYRWWIAGLEYVSLGEIDYYRIDLRFKDGHEHAYEVERGKFDDFRMLTSSVGQWLLREILGPGWTPTNKQCIGAIRNWPLN